MLKIYTFSIVNMHEVESVEWDQMREMLSCLGSSSEQMPGEAGIGREEGQVLAVFS